MTNKNEKSDYKIIISNDEEALKFELPKEVVEKIKEWSEYSEEDFKDKSNELIMDSIVKSLDLFLYAHKHSQITDEPIQNEEGTKMSKKKKTK